MSLPSSQRRYASRRTAKRVSCNGTSTSTSTVECIRYRGAIVDGPWLRRLFLD
jgi:hypothetical protein